MGLMCFHFKERNNIPEKELYITDALSRMQADNSDRKATIPKEELKMEIRESQDEDPSVKR